MSAAKQVYARTLHVSVPKGVIKKLLNTALESLLGDSPANIDALPLRASQRREASVSPVENASSLNIPSHPVRVVGELLNLTARQREILRSMTESVTANEYCKVEGGNAVFVSSSVNQAAVTLHAMGFSRERDGGRVAPHRFAKTFEVENGQPSIAVACVEMNADTGVVYTRISID